MGIDNRLISLSLAAASGTAGWLSERNYRRLDSLDGREGASAAGRVSIVVPCRNEARNLRLLLPSLRELEYDDYDVTVVDDGSSDETAKVATGHGVRLLRIDDLPGGWTGKSFACWTGAAATAGEWILFTDADTVHRPQSLSLALQVARDEGCGLVSVLPRQRCETFWERLLLPYAYALYFAGVSNPNGSPRTAVANGQYMLFRRSAYERVGGHQAVAESIVEDVALAKAVAAAGERVMLLRGEDQVDVRMYSNLKELWSGFAKNAFRFVAESPSSGVPTILTSLLWSSTLPIGARVRGRTGPWPLFLVIAIALVGWQRRFRTPLWYALLHPLTAAVFQLLALDSIRRSIFKRATVWKGRRY